MDPQPDFETLFEHCPSPYLLLASDLSIVNINTAYLRATGRDSSAMLGKSVFAAFPANPDQPDAGRLPGDERGHLRQLFDQAPGFIALLMGPEHVFEMVNQAYYQVVGYRDLLGKPVFEALPEVAGQGFEQLLDNVFNTGQPFVGHGLPLKVQARPGGPPSDIYVDLLYQPLFGDDGGVAGIFVQGHDVTETYKAQLASSLANQRLQEGMLAGGMVVWEWDLRTGKLHFSDNAPQVFGVSWDTIAQAWRALHPDDAPRLARAQRRALMEKTSYQETVRLKRPDNGATIWLDNRGKVECDASASPLRIRGVSIDITERKRAETALARANQKLAEQVQQLERAKARQAFRLQLSDLLRSHSDPARLFAGTSQLLGRQLRACRVVFADYHVKNQCFLFHSNYTNGLVGELDDSYPAPAFGAAHFEALETGATWISNDLSRDARTAGPATWPAFEALGIHAAIAVPLGGDGATLACLFVNDNTPRHWAEDEINLTREAAAHCWSAVERVRAEAALLEANRRKDQFLAMLAHELRNPLAPISAAAQLLRHPGLDPQRIRDSSDVVARQVGHMTALVNDLLDVSRATSGLVTLARDTVDMRRVVADAVEQSRPLMEARCQHLSQHLASGTAYVDGDFKRLVQVLANLLNNAAKYTPQGGHIALSMECGPGQLVLRVADNGIGMTPQLLPQVFELFTQAERSPDRAQGGLGLGLALVKRLVELHGGSVAADSKGLQAGSEFTVRLPRLQTEIAPEPAPGPVLAGAAPLRLMVVDDNVDAAQMLAYFLETIGHRVAVEHDPTQALQRARLEIFDAYLLDIGLPGMDGNELARELRLLPHGQQALLVAISGYGQYRHRQQSMASGFDHYLVKPADPQTVCALLADVSMAAARAEGAECKRA